jgi:hypothetical protein
MTDSASAAAVPLQTAVRSPLSLLAVIDLFCRPSRFFANSTLLTKTPEVLLVAWISGVAYVLGKIDFRLMQSELGSSSSTVRTQLTEWLTSSWTQYWFFAIALGALNAWILWYLAGWWYRKRLEWSGAVNPAPQLVRPLYMYQDLVMSAPAVLITVAETIVYRNYAEAWVAESWWALFAIVFVFWSCATSYKAATTAFTLSKWKARLWFLFLPIAVYLVVVGLVSGLYMLAEGNVA